MLLMRRMLREQPVHPRRADRAEKRVRPALEPRPMVHIARRRRWISCSVRVNIRVTKPRSDALYGEGVGHALLYVGGASAQLVIAQALAYKRLLSLHQRQRHWFMNPYPLRHRRNLPSVSRRRPHGARPAAAGVGQLEQCGAGRGAAARAGASGDLHAARSATPRSPPRGPRCSSSRRCSRPIVCGTPAGVRPAVPLVLLAGMGLYGGVAVLHDLAHGSLLPSKPAQRRLRPSPRAAAADGVRRLPPLAPRSSPHSQSTADPKRFGVEHKEETTHPDHSSLDLFPAPMRGLLRLGAKVVTLPLRMRHLVYLLILPLVMGPAVLFFSGEFSVARRDWRQLRDRGPRRWRRPPSWRCSTRGRRACWRFFLLALLIGHAFTFHVFATHMTPNQVYWTSARRAGMADALNVSDIHCGSLVRWLGPRPVGLSLAPSPLAGDSVLPPARTRRRWSRPTSRRCARRRSTCSIPRPARCSTTAIFSGVVYKNSESWDYADGRRHAAGGDARVRRASVPEQIGNWLGNVVSTVDAVLRPRSITELQEMIGGARDRLLVMGGRMSKTALMDPPGRRALDMSAMNADRRDRRRTPSWSAAASPCST